MTGVIIGVYPKIKGHDCGLPRKLFRKTNSVFLCECDKLYVLEWLSYGIGSERTWREISRKELHELRGY